MKGDRVPDEHHVARYCKPSTIDNGRITGASFQLREATSEYDADEYASVYWLELVSSSADSHEHKLERLRVFLRASVFREVGMRAKGRFGILRVAAIADDVVSRSSTQGLNVRHEPRGSPDVQDPHSGIYGYRFGHEADEICARLAELADSYLVGNVDRPA